MSTTPQQTPRPAIIGPVYQTDNKVHTQQDNGAWGETIAVCSTKKQAAHIVHCVNTMPHAIDLIQRLTEKVALWPEGANPEFLPMMKEARKFLAEQVPS